MYRWPKQFSLKQSRTATNPCPPLLLSSSGRLWCSMQGWFGCLLIACILTGLVCSELTGLHSFQSKETTEGKAHILPKALHSLCWGSPTGVICQTKVQACTSCKAEPESKEITWRTGEADCLQEDTGCLLDKPAAVGENWQASDLGCLQTRPDKEKQLCSCQQAKWH